METPFDVLTHVALLAREQGKQAFRDCLVPIAQTGRNVRVEERNRQESRGSVPISFLSFTGLVIRHSLKGDDTWAGGVVSDFGRLRLLVLRILICPCRHFRFFSLVEISKSVSTPSRTPSPVNSDPDSASSASASRRTGVKRKAEKARLVDERQKKRTPPAAAAGSAEYPATTTGSGAILK